MMELALLPFFVFVLVGPGCGPRVCGKVIGPECIAKRYSQEMCPGWLVTVCALSRPGNVVGVV